MPNPLLEAVTDNDVSTLRSLLEVQDAELFTLTAQTGTAEVAAYLLSRRSGTEIENHSRHILRPSPTLNPIQYLLNESARQGNVAVFRHLVSTNPVLLTTHNRNIESVLVNAMDGGVEIWRVILEHDSKWKDYEFSKHQGCVLEVAIRLKKLAILEFLLQQNADTDRAGDPLLECAVARRADIKILDLIKKYSA